MSTQSPWRYTGQSVIGTSHRKTGQPCQDAHQIRRIHNQLVAVAADGAGSAAQSDLASLLIVTRTMEILQSWNSFPDNKAIWKKEMLALTTALRSELIAKADNMQCPLQELSATMLLTVISETWIAGMQVGDGAIVYGGREQEPLHLLTAPARGEYLNETVFLVSNGYADHLQTVYIQTPVSRIALFSDGLQMLAMDMTHQPPQPHAPFFHPLFEFLRTVDDTQERERQLRNFLQSPRVCERTDDDKTLILALRTSPL